MLALPSKGMHRSVTEHNVNFTALCDWIEGSALFADQELSASEVVGLLVENDVYLKQDFAWEIVESALAEIERRLTWLGTGSPVEASGIRLTRSRAWEDAPGHSFCMALSFAKWYPNWAANFGHDYNEQGELFELLTKEAMESLFPHWTIHRTGWSKTQPSKLNDIVKQVVDHLGEAIGDVERWTDGDANEAGLDLLCYRPFVDGRVGVPVYLMQCGSGGGWDNKLHTPNLQIWTKIIQFAAEPKKAFAMPYALSDEEFRKKSNLVDGLLLDRYRLLLPCSNHPDWLSPALKERLVTWLKPRIALLPRPED
jgi:hypothetical protein